MNVYRFYLSQGRKKPLSREDTQLFIQVGGAHGMFHRVKYVSQILPVCLTLLILSRLWFCANQVSIQLTFCTVYCPGQQYFIEFMHRWAS